MKTTTKTTTTLAALGFALLSALGCVSEVGETGDTGEGGSGGSGGSTSTSSDTGGDSTAGAGGSDNTCVPGQQISCACPGGSQGVQVCESDGDSYGACQCGNDCDGNDCDNDGYASPNDCNDSDSNVNPGESEVCGNGKDDDCDDQTPDNCGGNQVCTPGQQISCACPGGSQGVQVCESDGDSYGACQCGGGGGCVPSNGGVEICDGLDNDCDGTADDGLNCGGGGDQNQICMHWMPGYDHDQVVKTHYSIIGDDDECEMNLKGADGSNEEFVCQFTFNAGTKVRFWPTSSKDGQFLPIFDVCNYAGAPVCGGQQAFCKKFLGTFWVTAGPCFVNGPVIWDGSDPGTDASLTNDEWDDNGDNLGMCTRNGELVVPAP